MVVDFDLLFEIRPFRANAAELYKPYYCDIFWMVLLVWLDSGWVGGMQYNKRFMINEKTDVATLTCPGSLPRRLGHVF